MATQTGDCNSGSTRKRIEAALRDLDNCEDEVRAGTLRLMHCAVRDRDVAAQSHDRRDGCAEAEIIAILTTMVEQREDSAARFESMGQAEEAERERAEIEVISEFLPSVLSEAEIRATAANVVNELQATGLRDLGRCMGEMKARLNGRFDAGKANAAVKNLLNS